MRSSRVVAEKPRPISFTKYFLHKVEPSGSQAVSLAALPLIFDGDEQPDGAVAGKVFLHGVSSESHRTVSQRAVAWRFEYHNVRHRTSVLTEDGKWIEIKDPHPPYRQKLLRTLLITLEMIHFVRWQPQSSAIKVLSHVDSVFRFPKKSSMEDFQSHRTLIRSFLVKDKVLATSLVLSDMLLKERHTSKMISEDKLESKKAFLVKGVMDKGLVGHNERGDTDNRAQLFDPLCAICDKGGDILVCQGRCLRSFHANREAGINSKCKTLGFSNSQVTEIKNFLCKNCEQQEHQCFACGKLGSSDMSVGAVVFRCLNPTCGHFYHPKCVARLLYGGNEVEAIDCERNIGDGQPFICPIHRCYVCNEGENKMESEWQFAMCRRCPKAYHRRCLPWNIAYDTTEEKDIKQRAWEGVLHNRILIYCLKHEMDEELGTPIRDHVIFPELHRVKKVFQMPKTKVNNFSKKKLVVSDSMPVKNTDGGPLVRSHTDITEEIPEVKKSLKPFKYIPRPIFREACGTGSVVKKRTYKEMEETSASKHVPSTTTHLSSFPVIRDVTKKKMRAFMDKVSASVTLDEVMKNRKMPSTHTSSGRSVDKITLGMIEGSAEAARSAIKFLEDGGSIEDAKSICPPEVVENFLKWNRELNVYLAPVIHGPRYTPYGRHFTKVNKLKEIVNKVQWYVHEGNMVVDFCCGSNDFSILMKEALDAAGKKCSFKNYDIMQSKIDFCFEKRDWLTVKPEELPIGSQLIMGLNPPFGVKASLANKFINHALKFRPKLLVLVVPPSTERLSEKSTPYDLIWEDSETLAGKSFYLPGSVDVDGKQLEQWNNTAPVLYLWSRKDYTQHHMEIALKQGHKASSSHGHYSSY